MTWLICTDTNHRLPWKWYDFYDPNEFILGNIYLSKHESLINQRQLPQLWKYLQLLKQFKSMLYAILNYCLRLDFVFTKGSCYFLFFVVVVVFIIIIIYLRLST